MAFNLTTTLHGLVNNVAPSLNITSHDLVNNVAPNLNDTSHDLATNVATLTSSQLAHNQITQEHATHVADISPLPANRTLCIWKRLARDNNMEVETNQGPMVTKRNREEEMEFLPELPSKKLQVSTEDCQQNTMVEAAQQPHQA